MSSRPWQQWVQDMLDAIAEIEQFCAGMTFDNFSADRKTLKAVSADFAILGEAAANIPLKSCGLGRRYRGKLFAECATELFTAILQSNRRSCGIPFNTI